MSKRPLAQHVLIWAILCVVMGSVWWAYSDSFKGPFIFDDKPAIFANPTLDHFNWHILNPPSVNGTTVGGRPLLNATLALDFHFGRLNTRPYHITNLVIHLLAVLALFGTVRRALETYPMFGYSTEPALGKSPSIDPLLFAGCAALLWGLHPLNTESVTYVVQRAESGAALFYILTLYCFIRSSASPRPNLWLTLSIVSVLLGATMKETVCTAPFVVLLFDRAFAAGSFKAALKERAFYYLSFIILWEEIAWLVISTGGDRGGSIGFGVSQPWWNYSLTQFEAVSKYIGLSFWPRDLVFNYGVIDTPKPMEIIPYIILTSAFVALAIWAVIKKPGVGFAAASFFIILGPTSSVIPGPSQMIVEHRTYLSVACVVVLVVSAAYSFFGRFAFLICALVAAVLGIFTYERNAEYVSEKVLWTTVTQRWPQNPEAWNDLGAAYYAGHEYQKAVEACREAIIRDPTMAAAYYNLGEAYAGAGRQLEAAKAYETSIERRPDFAEAHNNVGVIYLAEGRKDDALREFLTAARLNPNYIEAIENLAITYQAKRDPFHSKLWFTRALTLNSRSTNAHNGLADLAMNAGEYEIARDQYAKSLALNPNNPAVNSNMGSVLLTLNRPLEAIPYFEQALRLDNHRYDAALNVGRAFLMVGHYGQAIQAYNIAVALHPNEPQPHYDLANALAVGGKKEEAIAELRVVLKIDPNFSDTKVKIEQLQTGKFGM